MQKGRLAFHLYHQDRCSVAQQNLCLCCHAVTNEADTMLYISGGYKSLEPAPLVVKKKKKKRSGQGNHLVAATYD